MNYRKLLTEKSLYVTARYKMNNEICNLDQRQACIILFACTMLRKLFCADRDVPIMNVTINAKLVIQMFKHIDNLHVFIWTSFFYKFPQLMRDRFYISIKHC